ncbi:ATP-dependent RecD-like DNA helicase [Ligilactobacillus sp. LYQ60]|uniref:SF1B family DNA helicase RecD2 n=1 Tax=unclassified Ligilactobacillus TaxID=2767920 RepID=UPI003851F2DF
MSSENQGMHILTGKITHIIFAAPDSFYKVIAVAVTDTDFKWDDDELTVVGDMPTIQQGATYQFSGELVAHPKYGQQFRAQMVTATAPTSEAGVIDYLAGEDFPGIGRKTAARIVKVLGADAVNVLMEDPEQANRLGLTAKQKKTLMKTLRRNNGAEQAVIELNNYGFSGRLASKIYDHFREATMDILHDDPYRIAIEVPDVSFRRIDSLAPQLGMAPDNPSRLRGALFNQLELAAVNGDTYVDDRKLIITTQQLLGGVVEEQKLAVHLQELIKAEHVVLDKQGRVFMRQLYDAEVEIAAQFKRLLDQRPKKVTGIDQKLNRVERHLEIEYSDDQRVAIKEAIQHQCFILTGGPGTGKTTIINGYLTLFAMIHDLDPDDLDAKPGRPSPILLAAPTGRAANRLSEATHLHACTIHHLLGITGRGSRLPEEVEELSGALLIIDETSMVDTELMRLLVKSIPNNMQVLFVGDKDQLPSVGPGQVFNDLLANAEIPRAELHRIFRQQAGSAIVTLAHEIQAGRLPADFLSKQQDRSFTVCSANQVTPLITQVVAIALQKGIVADDIQVLAPMYRGPAGIIAINHALQEMLNPQHPEQKNVVVNDQELRIGDRVLYQVNNPDKEIYNGDIGTIISLIAADAKKKQGAVMTINFDGREVELGREDWHHLQLAYCMSIHKAQGSEFPVIIMPLVRQFHRMLARNLLYTAVTRAKQKLILLGDPQAFHESVVNPGLDRLTALPDRLHAYLQGEEEPRQDFQPVDKQQTEAEQTAEAAFTLTTALITNETIDPMIGMEGITPQTVKTVN